MKRMMDAMVRTISCCLFALLLGSTSSAQEPAGYMLPPEWEPHEAVWFTYTGISIDTVLDKMVLAMDTSTLVVCVADGDSVAAVIKARWEGLGIAPHRYRMEVIVDSILSPTVRDAGPIFLLNKNGGQAVLDAVWTSYGDTGNVLGAPPSTRALEDSFPTMLARRMGLPVVLSDLVIEGGACEINGRGDLLQVEDVTLKRNPGFTKEHIERELTRVLGAKRIIWLKQGTADDMSYLEPRISGDLFSRGTGGHVDEFCRFVNDSTVLLAWPEGDDLKDSVAAITRRRMEVNLRILEGAGLNVVKVPSPVIEYRPHVVDSTGFFDERVLLKLYPDLHDGDTIRYVPAASYLNFLITNGRVFVPAYWHEGKPMVLKTMDERMREVMEHYFPDRSIIQIDPRAINRYGGGMHCWTQQQPTANK